MNVNVSKPMRKGKIKPGRITAIGGDSRRAVIAIEVDAPNPGDEIITINIEVEAFEDREWIPSLITRLQAMLPGAGPGEFTVRAIQSVGHGPPANTEEITAVRETPRAKRECINPFAALKDAANG